MCGRFITPENQDIERFWHIAPPTGCRQSFNFAPSQLACVVHHDSEGQPAAQLFTWGFQPGWSQRAWINARSETAFESRAFAPAMRRFRCLVPAIGWYEWAGEKPKQPYLFHQPGFAPFAFAGICAARREDEELLRNFAILTRAAPAPLAALHHRMPVILPAADWPAWLNADSSPATLKALLGNAVATAQTYPVSTYVNKPANNDAKCIQPLAAG